MQSGKSTVVRQVLAQLKPGRVGGFRTEPLPEGRQAGFQLSSWDGSCVPFVRFPRPNAGLWEAQVDADVFSNQAAGWLRASANVDWCVIDELGILEQGVEPFVREVERLVDSKVPLLEVIQERALSFWLPRFPQERCRFYTLSMDNRDSLADQLAKELKQAHSNRLPG